MWLFSGLSVTARQRGPLPSLTFRAPSAPCSCTLHRDALFDCLSLPAPFQSLTRIRRYVLATAAISTTINLFHVVTTGTRRKAAGVPYPNAYASAEEAEKSVEKLAFNAAQRAHANFTENYTPFLISLGSSGLKFPVLATGLGASWIVARFLYAWGYARPGLQHSKDGKGRIIGAWGVLPLVGLMGLAIYTGVTTAL